MEPRPRLHCLMSQQSTSRSAAAVQTLIEQEVARQNAEIWKRLRRLEMKMEQMKWQAEL